METPASTRRVTRSQTRAAAAAKNNLLFSRKIEESENTRTKSRQQGDRFALVDITNDSQIAGLAMRSLKTPSSAAMSKKKLIGGSGEALLRAQVEALLQKFEEEKFNSPSIIFPQGRIESEDRITRSLLLDFSEKSSDEVAVDELCEGIRKISVDEFAGKHTRFVYDSDDDDI